MSNSLIQRAALSAAVLSITATLCTAMARADEAPDYAAETLSGDWGGLRSAAYERGIAIDSTLKVDWLRNRGGMADGQEAATNLDIKLTADLDALWGWNGTSAHLHLLDNRGGKPNAHLTGSLMGVSNIEVPDATAKVFQAWIQKNYLDDRLSLLIGLYPIDTEFSVVDSAGVFLHPAFGASADIAMTRGPSIFNTSSFGTRLKWRSESRSMYVQGAWLDGIPGDPNNPYGTHIKFDKGDGSFWIAEAGYTPSAALPSEGSADAAAEAPETFAKYALGLWRYTTRVDDLVDTDGAGNLLKRRSQGWYALAERTVYRNLAAFVRYSATDGDSTEIRSAVNLGLRLRGPIDGRADDIAGIGFTRASIGNKYRMVQTLAGVDSDDKETVVEVTYRAQVNKWLAIQPVLQRISHPGGDRALENVTTMGFRLEIAL